MWIWSKTCCNSSSPEAPRIQVDVRGRIPLKCPPFSRKFRTDSDLFEKIYSYEFVILGTSTTIKHCWSNIWDLLYIQAKFVLWSRHKTLPDKQNLIAMLLENFKNIFCFSQAKHVWGCGQTIKHFVWQTHHTSQMLYQQCLIVCARPVDKHCL